MLRDQSENSRENARTSSLSRSLWLGVALTELAFPARGTTTSAQLSQERMPLAQRTHEVTPRVILGDSPGFREELLRERLRAVFTPNAERVHLFSSLFMQIAQHKIKGVYVLPGHVGARGAGRREELLVEVPHRLPVKINRQQAGPLFRLLIRLDSRSGLAPSTSW